MSKRLSRRSHFLILAILAQALVLVTAIRIFADNFYVFSILSVAASAAAVFWILGDSSKPPYKLAWIIPILLLPVFGGLFYLFFGRVRLGRRFRAGMKRHAPSASREVGKEDGEAESLVPSLPPSAARQARYLARYAASPPFSGTRATYLPSGEEALAMMLEKLELAERCIFLEFFIIEDGEVWGKVLEILCRKAALGLDVRVMYDDFGCIERLGKDYPARLEALGIRCAVFNPLRPILAADMNHRDHRKILVIDNSTGFTGGINLADEYVNLKPRFGHWKDNSLMLEGPAVDALARMFLRLWNFAKGESAPIPGRCGGAAEFMDEKGIVQPFEDSPMDDEPVGEQVYLNMIGLAQAYLFITTPYLILDNEMTSALCLAAKGGVDVRIITPHIPDKWYVHMVSRANYRTLLESGVRIFEYRPGFIHSKTFVADDAFGVVGTINLDFRSLFLHFECGVWIYGSGAVAAMKEDFLSTQGLCVEMRLGDLEREGKARRVLAAALRLFSPLM